MCTTSDVVRIASVWFWCSWILGAASSFECACTQGEQPGVPQSVVVSSPTPAKAPQSLSVPGIVVDRVSGQPVPGIEIIVVEESSREIGSVVSDHQGSFRIDCEARTFPCVLSTRSRERALGRDDAELVTLATLDRAGEASKLQLVVDAGFVLCGYVVGPDGKAVEGTVVRAYRPDSAKVRSWRARLLDTDAFASPNLWQPEATTNSVGYFELRGLPDAGPYLVEWKGSDYAVAVGVNRADRNPVPERYALTRGVEWIVSLSGDRLPALRDGIAVVCQDIETGAPLAVARAATDSSDTYVIGNVPTSGVEIVVESRSGVVARKTLSLAPTDAKRVLRIPIE